MIKKPKQRENTDTERVSVMKKIFTLLAIGLLCSVLVACLKVQVEEQEKVETEELVDENEQIKSTPISEEDERTVVAENDKLKIFEPQENERVGKKFDVIGAVRDGERIVYYEVEDGHFIVSKGKATIREQEADIMWHDFIIPIELSDDIHGAYRLVIYVKDQENEASLHTVIMSIDVK